MAERLTPAAEHAVMEATRRRLGEEGYCGLTLAAVAEECTDESVDPAEHFDSKVDLAASFVEYERDRFEEFLMVTSDDPDERLRTLLDALIELDELEYDGILPAYMEMYGHAEDHDRLQSALETFDAFIYAALTETLEEGIAADQFHEVDPETTATMIFAAHDSALARRTIDADTTLICDALHEFVLAEVRRT